MLLQAMRAEGGRVFSGTPSSLQLLLPAQPQQRSHTPAPPTRLRNGPFGIESAC